MLRINIYFRIKEPFDQFVFSVKLRWCATFRLNKCRDGKFLPISTLAIRISNPIITQFDTFQFELENCSARLWNVSFKIALQRTLFSAKFLEFSVLFGWTRNPIWIERNSINHHVEIDWYISPYQLPLIYIKHNADNSFVYICSELAPVCQNVGGQ